MRSTGGVAVIDEGNGLNVEVHRGEYGCQRERDQGVGYEAPLGAVASAMDGVKESGHTFEEQHDEHSWHKSNERGEHGVADAETEIP